MRLYRFLLLFMALAVGGFSATALSPSDAIRADGEYSFPPLRAGITVTYSLTGTFGSGTATVGYLDAAGNFVSLGKTFTAAGAVVKTLPETSAGKCTPAVSLAGATSPVIAVSINKTDGGSAVVDSAAVASAIEEDPAAFLSAQSTAMNGYPASVNQPRLINTKWSLKKISEYLVASNPPLMVGLWGDSIAAGLGLSPNMAFKGYISASYANATGTVTKPTLPATDDWVNGIVITAQAGSSFQLARDGVDEFVPANAVLIGYIREPGAGSFIVEQRSSTAGSWTQIGGTNSASNATKDGAVFTHTSLPTTNNPAYKIRVTVSGGAVRFICGGLYYNNAGGAVLIDGVFNQTGREITGGSALVPDSIFTPVYTAISPDLWLVCHADGAFEYDAGGGWRSLYAKCKAIKNATDFVMVGPHAMLSPALGETASMASVNATRKSQRAWAEETGECFIDTLEVIRSNAEAAGNGLKSDDAHLSAFGQAVRNAHVWQTLPLGRVVLGKFGGREGRASVLTDTGFEWYGTGNSDAAQMVSNRPLGTLTRFVVFATDWARDFSKNMTFSLTNSVGTVSVNGSNILQLSQGALSGIQPAGDGMTLGTTSLRWRGFFNGISAASTTKTANYTATAADYLILCDATSAGFTVSLPSASASGMTGKILVMKKIDSSGNAITLDGFLSETIDGALTQTITVQWSPFAIMSNGTNWFKIN